MTDFSVEGLARKYCRGHPQGGTTIPPCTCRMLAAAVREALEAAEKTIMELEFMVDEDPFQRWTTKGGSFAKQGAAAIAALRGTP